MALQSTPSTYLRHMTGQHTTFCQQVQGRSVICKYTDKPVKNLEVNDED